MFNSLKTNIESVNLSNSMSLRSVFWGKILTVIAENSLKVLFKKFLQLFIGIFVGAFMFNPDMVGKLGLNILSFQHYAPLKIIGLFTLISSRKSLGRLFRTLRKFRIKVKDHLREDTKLIDGIPVQELTDYLIRNKHFKREGVNGVRETFGLNMERFNKLAQQLEQHGVLTRGPNNLRILANRWTRQALLDFLGQNEKSKDMAPWIRIQRIGGKVRLDHHDLQAAL